MKRAWATVLGVVSAIPLIFFAYFVAVLMSPGESVAIRNARLNDLFAYQLGLMAVSLVLTVVYLIVVYRSPLISGDKRGFWAAIAFWGNVFAFAVLWYMFIWRPAMGARNETGAL